VTTVVTISASYGAGGNWVAAQVAKRLGYRFVDRGIPAQAAERLGVSVQHAEAHDQAAAPRFTRLLARLPNTSGVLVPEATIDAFSRETEHVLIQAADSGEVVVLGRAAAHVLRDRPNTLHVRLDGPEQARVAQAMRLQAIDEHKAKSRQRNLDRLQVDYVKHFYHADPRDPRHYHILLNSTALPLETCVEVTANAVSAR
jgi:cytidylate kinase